MDLYTSTARYLATALGSDKVRICLLGNFRVLTEKKQIQVEGKTQALLSCLALKQNDSVPREKLLDLLWPDRSASLAGSSLNSLVYSVHKLLGDELDGAAPIVCAEGGYSLNTRAGMAVDVADFDALADAGDRELRAGRCPEAVAYYQQASGFYRGDLSVGVDLHAVIERERLRARYLNLLSHLADFAFSTGDYDLCLQHALRLLAHDPCREDAHRLVMRCYVRQGQRAQALRQFRLCETALRQEFDTVPEQETQSLFDRIRVAPERI